MKYKTQLLVLFTIALFMTSITMPARAMSDCVETTEFVIKDYFYDTDSAIGLSGTFRVSVKGYYHSGQTKFYKVDHWSSIQLAPFHSIENLVVIHESDAYYYDFDDEEEDLFTFGRYTEDVYDMAITTMEVDVYYFGIPVGHISLEAGVEPPSP
jgi:hypothetical protein